MIIKVGESGVFVNDKPAPYFRAAFGEFTSFADDKIFSVDDRTSAFAVASDFGDSEELLAAEGLIALCGAPILKSPALESELPVVARGDDMDLDDEKYLPSFPKMVRAVKKVSVGEDIPAARVIEGVFKCVVNRKQQGAVSFEAIRAFIDPYYVDVAQRCPSGINYVILDERSNIVAVAIFAKISNVNFVKSAFKNRTEPVGMYELSRFVVLEKHGRMQNLFLSTVIGFLEEDSSRLTGAGLRVVLGYADQSKGEDGADYISAGFDCVGLTRRVLKKKLILADGTLVPCSRGTEWRVDHRRVKRKALPEGAVEVQQHQEPKMRFMKIFDPKLHLQKAWKPRSFSKTRDAYVVSVNPAEETFLPPPKKRGRREY
jgi:hypothetical protein